MVGAGPAGATAALAVKAADPGASVLMLDRSDFPRDKACGDGVAPHVLDVLAEVGVTGLLDDRVPIPRLRLQRGDHTAIRSMGRPAYVVPRTVFDSRLVAAAGGAGAVMRRHRVRSMRSGSGCTVIDDEIEAKVVIGCDGAQSAVRTALGLAPGRRALAIRGYAPTPRSRQGQQVIVFGRGRQPSYAWSFDRGDGLANVGYGELLTGSRPAPTRRHLLGELELLLPGATADSRDWLGHHLPLSSWRWQHPDGRVLLAGDAAGLINPLTGEGIYYAVATGVLAGRAAVGALTAGETAGAAAQYRTAVRTLLARHHRHTAAASRLVSFPVVAAAAVRACAHDQAVFDDLIEVGLGQGLVTRRVLHATAAGLLS
ncbi:MAG: NAD(P)/FAD-dependent oxidoreductase [Propionibacteriales bacterium]|nr:NAD(P)/FAD-dependent oxidoreductase [Propionibacteriales bacterium]